MRVGYDASLAASPTSGVCYTVNRGVHALVENGSDIDWVVYTTKDFNKTTLNKYDNVSISTRWYSSRRRIFRMIFEQLFLSQKMWDDDIDLFHAPAYTAPRSCAKPLVLTVHDTIAFDYPTLCTRKNVARIRRILPLSVKRASRIITPTQDVASSIVRLFSYDREKIDVIPWGVNDEFISPNTDAFPMTDFPYICCVGVQEKKKNHAQLVRAFYAARTHAAFAHHLVFVGPSGSESKLLRSTIKSLNVENYVHILPPLPTEHLAAVVAQSSLMCLPSLAEGFCLPALEALAAGTPVLANNIPEIRSATNDYISYTKDASLASWREGIESLLASPPDIAEATAFAGSQTWGKYALEVIETYKKVMSKTNT